MRLILVVTQIKVISCAKIELGSNNIHQGQMDNAVYIGQCEQELKWFVYAISPDLENSYQPQQTPRTIVYLYKQDNTGAITYYIYHSYQTSAAKVIEVIIKNYKLQLKVHDVFDIFEN